LKDIYNSDYDSVNQATCCKGITIFEFPLKKCATPHECFLERKRNRLFPRNDAQLDRDPMLANHCIHIFVYSQMNYRICHRNKDTIMKLKNTISVGVLRTVPGANVTELIRNHNILIFRKIYSKYFK